MQQPAPITTRLEVFDVLDQIESITGAATKLPLTNRAVLNPADLTNMVGALRRALPAEVREAQQIIRFRDSILSHAHNEAKRIRAGAEQESLNTVSETEVVRASKLTADRVMGEARERASEVLAQAEATATRRVQGADGYAEDVLEKLEGELSALLATARRGLETLAQTRDTPDSGDAESAS